MKKFYHRLTLVLSAVLITIIPFSTSIVSANENELPQWVKTIKMNGDLRLRYQLTQQNGSTPDRSGGDDPRSTNQTFDDSFSSKGLQFDYAFVKVKRSESAKLLGGKTVFKEHEVITQVGLKENVIFGIDYYMTEEINGPSEEDIVQVDLQFKF